MAYLYRAGDGVMPPSEEQLAKLRDKIEGLSIASGRFFVAALFKRQCAVASALGFDRGRLGVDPTETEDQRQVFESFRDSLALHVSLATYLDVVRAAGGNGRYGDDGQPVWYQGAVATGDVDAKRLYDDGAVHLCRVGGLMRYYGISLWRFLSYIKAELLIVLGASSSEAALPALMEKLERMGCAKPIVGLVVPAGYSFNLDGTTIYLSMATIFLAQVYHVDLSWWQLLTIIGVLMLTSKGAAGVTGMGFVYWCRHCRL